MSPATGGDASDATISGDPGAGAVSSSRGTGELSELDEVRLGALLEIASDAVVAVDQEGLIVLLNATAERLFGFARRELVGEPVEVLVPSHARARHVLHRLAYGVEAGPRRFEVRATRRDGGEFPIEITLNLLSTAAGYLVIAAIRDITERRLAEAGLARLAAVANSSHEAIIAKTLDGVITDWNPAAERMYGYKAQDAIGRPISMLLASDDQRAELTEIMQRVRGGKAVENHATTRRRADDAIIDVELTISPIRDAHGEITGVSTIGRDIGDRKRVEEALRRTQERLEQAEAVAQMGSSEWDLTTNRVSWSPGMYNILGLKPEAASMDARQRLADRVHPADRELVRRALDRTLSGQASASLEYRAIRADGHIRVFEWHADTIVDEAGAPVRVIEVVHDVTDAKRRYERAGGATSQTSPEAGEPTQQAPATGADDSPSVLRAALTARQLEMLRMVAQGLTNAEIAKRLFISEATVKFHIRQILSKTKSTNRTEAVARVLGGTFGP